jgi:hypothetical protein
LQEDALAEEVESGSAVHLPHDPVWVLTPWVRPL